MKDLNDILASLPKERQHHIQNLADALILEKHLFLIREELHLSQQDIAHVLGISQPSVAKIEQRGNDLKIATLKRYIESMGGKLSFIIDLPTGTQRVFSI